MTVEVGSFQVSTGVVGTIYSVTGLAERPDAVFFRWTGHNSAVDYGPAVQSFYEGYGFMLANGSRGCMTSYCQHGADPYGTGCGLWESYAIVQQIGVVAAVGKADFHSMNADGFSVIIDEAFGAEFTVIYEAISGRNFNVIEITEPAATGVQEYIGAGFPPTFVKFLTTDATVLDTMSGDTVWGMGAASGTGEDQQFTWSMYELSGAGSTTSQDYCRRTECLSVGPASMRAKLQGFTSDGFDLNWLERASNRKVLAIVSDGRWYVGNGLTSVALATPWSLSDFIWSPEGVEIISCGAAEHAQDVADDNGLHFSVGFGTGMASRNLMSTRRSFNGNTGNSRCAMLHQFDEIYGDMTHDAAPALKGLMDIESDFSPDNIELTMDDADPGAYFFGYIAIGPPITEFRDSLVQIRHNTYQSAKAGRVIFSDTFGREIKPEQLQTDNWAFSGGIGFPTPVKYENHLEDPNVFYIESVSVIGGKVAVETNREGFFESIMRKLGRG